MTKKPKGKYRFGVKVYKLRRTKFWTRSKCVEVMKDQDVMLRVWI